MGFARNTNSRVLKWLNPPGMSLKGRRIQGRSLKATADEVFFISCEKLHPCTHRRSICQNE